MCDAVGIFSSSGDSPDHEVEGLGSFCRDQRGGRRGGYLADANEDRGPWVKAHTVERIGRAATFFTTDLIGRQMGLVE